MITTSSIDSGQFPSPVFLKCSVKVFEVFSKLLRPCSTSMVPKLPTQALCICFLSFPCYVVLSFAYQVILILCIFLFCSFCILLFAHSRQKKLNLFQWGTIFSISFVHLSLKNKKLNLFHPILNIGQGKGRFCQKNLKT